MEFSEALSLDNAVKQLTTVTVLHDDVHVAVVDEWLMELHDVWVVDLLEDKEFFF